MTKRPPLISSSVFAIHATSPGLRNGVHITSGPNSTLVVASARAPSIVIDSQTPRFSRAPLRTSFADGQAQTDLHDARLDGPQTLDVSRAPRPEVGSLRRVRLRRLS